MDQGSIEQQLERLQKGDTIKLFVQNCNNNKKLYPFTDFFITNFSVKKTFLVVSLIPVLSGLGSSPYVL